MREHWMRKGGSDRKSARGWVQRAWRGPHGRGTCARARVHNYRALLSRGNHMEEEHALNIWLSSCALCFFWTLVIGWSGVWSAGEGTSCNSADREAALASGSQGRPQSGPRGRRTGCAPRSTPRSLSHRPAPPAGATALGQPSSSGSCLRWSNKCSHELGRRTLWRLRVWLAAASAARRVSSQPSQLHWALLLAPHL